MRSVEEAVILVTGATDGLGKLVARDLAAGGAAVLLHGRSERKLHETLREIREETGNNRLEPFLADLSSLDEVRRLADGIASGQSRLDVLVNNAGIIARERAESADGFELTFAVNYLSHFLLTARLLPLLRGSAPSRVVNVASVGQAPIDFDDVMLEKGYSGMRAYSQSKLAQILFTFDLAEKLEGTGVTANCLHPATLMDTRMVAEAFGGSMSDVREGADATVRLILSPELEGVSGKYFDGQQESRADGQAYDPEARAKLWKLSEELTGERMS